LYASFPHDDDDDDDLWEIKINCCRQELFVLMVITLHKVRNYFSFNFVEYTPYQQIFQIIIAEYK
jgi:hypothetical protein